MQALQDTGEKWWGQSLPGETLIDLKWVESHGPTNMDTPGMQACRKMMKERPVEYYAILTKLEAEYWEKERSQNPQLSQESTEKDEMMEGLLREEWAKVKKVV